MFVWGIKTTRKHFFAVGCSWKEKKKKKECGFGFVMSEQ